MLGQEVQLKPTRSAVGGPFAEGVHEASSELEGNCRAISPRECRAVCLPERSLAGRSRWHHNDPLLPAKEGPTRRHDGLGGSGGSCVCPRAGVQGRASWSSSGRPYPERQRNNRSRLGFHPKRLYLPTISCSRPCERHAVRPSRCAVRCCGGKTHY